MKSEIEAARLILRKGLFEEFVAEMTTKERKDLLPVFDIAQNQLSHLRFMRACWGRKRPMVIGLHTWYMCKQIDTAFEDFRNDKSTFLINLICFRHGKSEVTTRYLPLHFMAEFPDREVIVTSHSGKNTAKFSRFGRTLIKSKLFQQLYPGINLSKENAGVEEWGIDGSEAVVQFFGIGSGITGTGGALIITDDYFGKREEAESKVIRDKVFEAYSDNIFTRQDDPCINLITVTPWHADDLVGRLQKIMRLNKDATQYKIVKMPYKEPDNRLVEEIRELIPTEENDELRKELMLKLDRYASGGYLFSEKYSDTWYKDMENTLGGPNGYGTVSLMRCDPKNKSGNDFKTENVKYLKYEEFTYRTKGLTFVRAWDLASTTKQLVRQDPDYTVGVKMAVRWISTAINNVYAAEVYIADVIRGRWETTKRRDKIIETAMADGLIRVGIEAYGQYTDAYNELKSLLRGLRVVKKMRLPGDKIAKAANLFPVFDGGNFYVLEAHWNLDYIDEFAEWPGSHDDQVDATAVGFGMNKPVESGLQYDEQYVL